MDSCSLQKNLKSDGINMTNKIKVKVPNKQINATVEFSNESPKTVKKILEVLPIKGSVNTWGEEIYFNINISIELEENARSEADIGEVGYWDSGTAFCIFFGKTPASGSDNKPKAIGPVNMLGKIIDIDPKKLLEVNDGDEILLEKA